MIHNTYPLTSSLRQVVDLLCIVLFLGVLVFTIVSEISPECRKQVTPCIATEGGQCLMTEDGVVIVGEEQGRECRLAPGWPWVEMPAWLARLIW